MIKSLLIALGLVVATCQVFDQVFDQVFTKNAYAQVPIEPDSRNPTTTIPAPKPPSDIPASKSPSDITITKPTTPSNKPNSVPSSIPADSRFSCQFQDGKYTVMYQPKSRPGKFYAWAVPGALGGGWTSDRRCNEITRRLEEYRPDGLVELRTGTENGYNVVCATTDKNNACRIVLTVPVGADPNNIRDRVFANLASADSGQTTTGVNTFVQGERSSLGGLFPVPRSGYRSNNGIDLKPFLDSADGGTGRELGAANSRDSKGLRFRPNRF